MSAARSVNVTFRNYVDTALALKEAHLDHGIWTPGYLPLENIGAGSQSKPTATVFAAESQGFMTGVEGYVVYWLADGKFALKLYFDNPYAGGDSYGVSLDGPLADEYQGAYTGGEGDNATVTMTLTGK